jgi:hypothetical protein
MANTCEKCKRNGSFTIGSKQGTLCDECINEIANDWEDISNEDLICDQCKYEGDRENFIVTDSGPWCINCFGDNVIAIG